MNKINILSILCLLVVSGLLFFKTCHPTIIEKPVFTSITEQKTEVVKDTIAIKKITDSFNLVNKKLQVQNISSLKELYRLQLKGKELEVKIITDTIYPTVINDYVNNSNQKDTACNSIISNFQTQLANNQALIAKKDAAYKKQLSNLDTCFSQQKKLEKYIDKSKQRNQVYAGVSATIYPALGYGVDLGVRLKNGLMIEGRALQMQGNTYGQLAFKRVISFRK